MNRLLFLAWALLVATVVHGQSGPPITVEASSATEKLAPGSRFQVSVTITIPAPWHINANPAGDEALIPTTLQWQTPPGITIDQIKYPAGKQTKVDWSDKPIGLYDGRVRILTEASIDPTTPAGPIKLTGKLRYQACDDATCFAPQSVPVSIELTVSDEAAPASATLPAVAAPAATAGDENAIDSLIRQRGWALALLFVFLGGLALNLTPCVYPMIAITVSYFGGQGERQFGRAFASATTYFIGIVLTYSALGLVAALTGGLFGALLQSSWVLLGVAVLLVALALSMFGLYELQPPQFLMQKAAGLSGRAGYLGVFFLGAMVGVIAAPCVAPILVALLVFVGQRGDPWIGWWLFFTLAAGLGLPYVVLGTFSGLLTRLPKSGTWMVWVKRIFGVGLLLVAAWITSPLWLPQSPVGGGVQWEPYSPSRLEEAKAAGQPVIIDFYADWCLPCKEMEKFTFRDQQVVAKAQNFVRLKADLTHTGSPEVEALTKQFNIVGVPTVVFIGADGQERTRLRLVGFEKAGDFLKRLEAVE
jgi:thiol:disulfide interchange protein DsbD